MPLKIKLRFCLLLTALLSIDGCAPQQAGVSYPGHSNVGSEELLQASSQLNMSDDEENLSPLEQHLRARSRVDPTKLNDSPHYTQPGSVPNEETHFRVVRLTGAEKEQAHVPSRTTINPAPVLALAAQPAAAKAPEPPRAATKGAAVVRDVRTGQHPGKTRLVFDLTGPSGYSYKLDNAAHTLRVELPGAGWDAMAQKSFAGGGLLQSYSAGPLSGGGTVVVIRLKSAARVLTSVALKPGGTAGDRIYFDISTL